MTYHKKNIELPATDESKTRIFLRKKKIKLICEDAIYSIAVVNQ